MALDYNTVQNTLNIQATDVSKENKARAADSNVLSLVALLSDSVQEAHEGGKKNGLGATYKSGNLKSASTSSTTETGNATSYRDGLKEISQLLSKLLNSLLESAEKMEGVNNDLDKSSLAQAQNSLADAKSAAVKNAQAEKQQAQAKAWGIFACIAVAIIGVVVSFATCGTTAGFVALALAAVLTTLTLTGVVQMVTDDIATALEKDGCSSGLAKVLAAIIVTVIEVVLSAGTGAGASAIADGVSSSLTGAASEVATEITSDVASTVGSDVAEDAADDVTESVSASVKKTIVKSLSKLSKKAAEDPAEINKLVDTAVTKAVKELGTTVGDDASDALKAALKKTLNSALKNSTKSQVINGINGVKAAAYGAARGAVTGLGSAISGSSDLVDGSLTLIYGDDKTKWPQAAQDIAAAIQAILAIVSTLMGEGVVGNVGNAAKSTLSEIGGKVAAFAEKNAVKITVAETTIEALGQGGGSAASIAGGVAEKNMGLAEQDQDNFLAESGLAQYLLNFTNQMSSNDRDRVNEAMKTISSELANIVQSRGKTEDFLANVSSQG